MMLGEAEHFFSELIALAKTQPGKTEMRGTQWRWRMRHKVRYLSI